MKAESWCWWALNVRKNSSDDRSNRSVIYQGLFKKCSKLHRSHLTTLENVRWLCLTKFNRDRTYDRSIIFHNWSHIHVIVSFIGINLLIMILLWLTFAFSFSPVIKNSRLIPFVDCRSQSNWKWFRLFLLPFSVVFSIITFNQTESLALIIFCFHICCEPLSNWHLNS